MKITIDTNESPDQIRKLIKFLQEIIGEKQVQAEIQDAPTGAFNMFSDAPVEKEEEPEIKIMSY